MMINDLKALEFQYFRVVFVCGKWYNRSMKKDNAEKQKKAAADVDLTAMTRQELEEFAMKAAEQSVINEAEAEHWRELYQREINRKYGRKKDTAGIDDAQISFFNEAEATADPDVPEPSIDEVREKPSKKTKKKKGHQKKALPVKQVEYKLTEEEQVCPKCGSPLHVMKKVVHEEIVVEPAKFHIERSVSYVYSCRNCEQNDIEATILQAEHPKAAFPHSLLSPSLAAWIIYRKYEEAMPLYRQSQSLARFGMDLSRQTLSNWVLRAEDRYFDSLYERLKDHLVRNDIVHADETRLMVVKGRKEPGKPDNGYMWLYRTGKYAEHPVILYEYQPGRGHEYPEAFLKDFSGYLQTDGYAAYREIADEPDRKAGKIVPVGCWAHLQRKFCDAKKAAAKGSKTPHIDTGIEFCRKIFQVEKKCEDMNFEGRKVWRAEHAAPILDEFFDWIHHMEELSLPKSLLGTAVTYASNQETELRNYLLDGRLEVSNNIAERSIKPFVIGRKNFLFAFTEGGAAASSVLYSIVETAKANGLNSYEYMKYVMEVLSQIDTPEDTDFDRLLPWSEDLPEVVRQTPDPEQ